MRVSHSLSLGLERHAQRRRAWGPNQCRAWRGRSLEQLLPDITYHAPSDTPETLDYAFMARVCAPLAATLGLEPTAARPHPGGRRRAPTSPAGPGGRGVGQQRP